MLQKYKLELYRLAVSAVGIVVLGLAINLLSWKYRLISGGLPGYALSINYLTGISAGTFLLIGNTVILFLSLIIVGKTAGLRGIFGYTFLAFFIDSSRQALRLEQIQLSSFTPNVFLVALQGFIAPIGIALVITHGYSFGSYSSIVPIVHKYKKISPPVLFWVFDFLLILITLIFFGFEKALLLLINATVFYFSFKYFLSLFHRSPLRTTFDK